MLAHNKMVTKETARKAKALVQHPTKPNKMVTKETARRAK